MAEALTEFSADLTYLDSHNRAIHTGRLFVSNDAVREERRGQDGSEAEIRITDLFRGVMYVLNPERGEYYQQEATPIPRDPASFCAEMALLLCGFQSEEELMGKWTERWGAEFGLGELSIGVVAWYDPEIQYPLRIELNRDSSMQLSNVETGRLSSSLFSIPFRYRRVEPSEMVQAGDFPEWP